jgi:hypothetical protein
MLVQASAGGAWPANAAQSKEMKVSVNAHPRVFDRSVFMASFW